MGQCILVVTDQENITKEAAACRRMALYPRVCLECALEGMALIDVEVMIYEVQNLNRGQAALPACCLSLKDS